MAETTPNPTPSGKARASPHCQTCHLAMFGRSTENASKETQPTPAAAIGGSRPDFMVTIESEITELQWNINQSQQRSRALGSKKRDINIKLASELEQRRKWGIKEAELKKELKELGLTMYYNTVDGEPHGQAIGQSPSTQDTNTYMDFNRGFGELSAEDIENGLQAGVELALGYELTELNTEIPYMLQNFQ
ncbi:hypothetical protein M422DRAFT_49334 [Sphaerobolus stellatus SS14]|uniref:Unplaced genomic scaffold SPHSTscaffold_71, whole genome shotgun sequence n=1 Tax=Sphaerobolus stellatus (strain SS14) TaxID=990650 RepID=A0A0C9UZ94_SPHS4|nr:hypothetical protein M422DRAFT_49334 [Sphaerobolus stellatus SS14]